MKEEILFRMKSLYRDEFKIRGFRFGEGEKTLAIVGAMRGDEVQQQFICSQIVKNLVELEEQGKLNPGHEILVIPSANHYSMNIDKRFWAMDNTDINRMFPGYDKGETTQRIASVIFENVRDYKYGIQLASFYLPGNFIPHISMMETGYYSAKTAHKFGLPYILLRKPKSYDTALLNYNWQVFGTEAFSLYAGQTDIIDKEMAKIAWTAVLRFLSKMKVIDKPIHNGYHSYTLRDRDLVIISSQEAGILYQNKHLGESIKEGDVLAKILDPFTGVTQSAITSPTDGVLFFTHHRPLVHQNTLLYKIAKI